MTTEQREAAKQAKVEQTDRALVKAQRALRLARKAGGFTDDLEREVFSAQLANNVALREAGEFAEILLTTPNMKDGDPTLNLSKRKRAA